MAFIPWPNGISLCFDFSTAGQNWQFCLALRKSAGAPTDSDLISVANEGYNGWVDNLKDLITDQTTLRQVRATNMTAQGAPQYVQNVAETGTNTGDSVPLSACNVVSLRTAKRGRSYRGRAYIGGYSVAHLTDPVTADSGVTAGLTNFVQDLKDALDALGFDLVVPSRQHNGVVTNPAELNEVTAIVTDAKIDSQRRRLSGRGT
jgi:hypothetical protein